MPDGETPIQESSAAHDEEESGNAEVDHEVSCSKLTSSEDSSDECTVCGASALLAKSRLQRGWMNRWNHLKDYIVFGHLEANSGTCYVCQLIVDAITTWKAIDSQGVQDLDISFNIYSPQGHISPTIEVYNYDETSKTNYNIVALEVFRMKNIKSPWNLQELTETTGDTSSPQASSLIKQWLHECQHEHELCRKQGQYRSVPDRILELAEDRITLRQGIEMQPRLQYACLSHCWGPRGPSLRLTDVTSEALKSGVSIEHMPKTFQDAIKLCLRIDIQYLWIDALCIRQDNKTDWEIAAASMGNIYENATITIAATCSSSSDQGCFSRTPEEMMARPILDTGLFVRRKKSTFPSIETTADKGLWPLLCRAWVFQERKLSPRVVHLAREQLYWECDTCLVTEDGFQSYNNAEHRNHNLLKKPQPDPMVAWREAVEHYSSLDLTYGSDRLPAISALVKRLQPLRKGDTYLAGMWVDSLLADLTWHVAFTRPQSRPTEKYPTWSWVSVREEVRFSERPLLQSVQLIDAYYKTIRPLHIGHTEHASITVKGPFLTVEFTTYDWSRDPFYQRPFNVVHNPGSSRDSILSGHQLVDFDYRTADPLILPGEKLVLLLLLESCSWTYLDGIVLRSTEQEVYERVGYIQLRLPSETGEEVLESLPIKQFKIV